MAHKGKTQYTGLEIGNLGLGQGGWIWTNPQVNDIFHAGAGTDTGTAFYYDKVDYWLGVKCYPTTDSSDGDCLLTVELTPLDTNLIDQSKADTPGSAFEVKLQAGQAIFGAFKSVKVTAAAECTGIIYKN
jgi:hypothetical protein